MTTKNHINLQPGSKIVFKSNHKEVHYRYNAFAFCIERYTKAIIA